MRFNLERFQQSVLVELGLKTDDMIILMYIIDFYNSSKMYKKTIDFKDFFWINYQTILDELPILGFKKRNLAQKFDKFVECGLMEKILIKGEDVYIHNAEEKNRTGTFTYFHLNPEIIEKLLGQKEGGCKKNDNGGVKKITAGGDKKSTTKDSSTILDSSTKDINLIVSQAEKNPKFAKAFSEFLLSDDNEHRKEMLYWIFHNAEKFESTLEDIIHALEICYDKEKVGDMSYFTGILRKKAKNREKGIKPMGKPKYWIVDEYLRNRLKIHGDYIKNYDIDLEKEKLYYSVFCPEERNAVHDVFKLTVQDLQRETGVSLEPEFRIG